MRKRYQDSVDAFVSNSSLSYGTVTPEFVAKYQRSNELYAHINKVMKKVKRVIYNSTDPAMLELTEEMKLDLLIKETSQCITAHWEESNRDFDLECTLTTIETLIRFFDVCDNQ